MPGDFGEDGANLQASKGMQMCALRSLWYLWSRAEMFEKAWRSDFVLCAVKEELWGFCELWSWDIVKAVIWAKKKKDFFSLIFSFSWHVFAPYILL